MSECCSAGFSSWDGRLNAAGSSTIGKTKKTAKQFEKSEAQSRKRALLLLIAAYLRESNLHGTADSLANEAQLTLGSYELCDNIDLDIILQDYQTYYQTKFGRSVRLVRNKKDSGEGTTGGMGVIAGGEGGGGSKGCGGIAKRKSMSGLNSTNQVTRKNSIYETEVLLEIPPDPSLLEISVTSLSKNEKLNPDQEFLLPQNQQSEVSSDAPQTLNYYNSGPLQQRPLHEFEGYTLEWREFADQVMKEVIHSGLGDGRRVAKVTWTDCIGVDECVQVLKEAVVYPVRYPEWFQSRDGGAGHGPRVVSPWRGLLLYGPPGTGKTLLAKAVASEATTTFINLTASTFVSKWRGDSEKLLKVLFDIARFYAPTTIFIDELDSLAGKHEDNQHEASKRFTSELLIQLDGLLYDNDRVFVLATTNNPWHIHNAMLRRFEKRLHVPLPSLSVRQLLFQHYLQPFLSTPTFTPGDYHQMALRSVRYSGADIRLVCKEVAMQLVREKISAVEAGGRVSKSGGKTRGILLEDVMKAIGVVRRTCTEKEEKMYEEWMEKYQ